MFWEMSAHTGWRRAGGLLLLRLSFTVTLVQLALGAGAACPSWAWWCWAGLALGLVPGLLSCPCALAGAVLALCLASLAPQAMPVLLALVVALGQALAIVLLGAGRWSVDRRLFGRRLVFDSDDSFG